MSGPAGRTLIQQQALLTLARERQRELRPRPPLDWSPPPSQSNAKPAHFQVIDEGNLCWHASEQEYQGNLYCDCGPIALAHAVNFTNWALGRPETLNAGDGIREAVAEGAYRWGDQTQSVELLGQAISRLTGLEVRFLWNGPDWDTALALARTRWLIVNKPGHVSLVVADRDGADRLELVQHRVSVSGQFDAIDLVITADEWDDWKRQTVHPLRELWLGPG